MKILICGLSNSGKTTLAKELFKSLAPDVEWFNADAVRAIYNHWDFSHEGRMIQAVRMRDLADKSNFKYVICDFIAPTQQIRDLFAADIVIWMNTVNSSQYKDTDQIFERRLNCTFRVDYLDAVNLGPAIASLILQKG